MIGSILKRKIIFVVKAHAILTLAWIWHQAVAVQNVNNNKVSDKKYSIKFKLNIRIHAPLYFVYFDFVNIFLEKCLSECINT